MKAITQEEFDALWKGFYDSWYQDTKKKEEEIVNSISLLHSQEEQEVLDNIINEALQPQIIYMTGFLIGGLCCISRLGEELCIKVEDLDSFIKKIVVLDKDKESKEEPVGEI